MTTTNLTSAQRTLTQSWKERIDSWSESGLSKSAYCKNHNINYHQMIYWSNKLSPTNVSSSGFVAVSVQPVAITTALSLRLPNGIEILGVEEHRIASIIQRVSGE